MTRLRSRHRLFEQGRADRSRLRGSLIANAVVLFGAVIWWHYGYRPVAVAWAAGALLLALSSVWDHRRGLRAGAVEERWRLRGLPGPGSIAVTVGVAVVSVITLRFGVGRTWEESVSIPSVMAISPLVFAWRDARRYRKYVSERRVHKD